MKDENGIDINCDNCAFYNSKYCEAKCTRTDCLVGEYFTPTEESLQVYFRLQIQMEMKSPILGRRNKHE